MPRHDDPDEQLHPASPYPAPVEGAAPVGYKRPPKHTRFAKGQSGNPAGRPKGSLNRATVRAMLESVWVEETVTVIIGGRERQIPRLNALAMRQAEIALKGDRKAIKDCFDLLLRLISDVPEPRSDEESADEDMAILCTHHAGVPDPADPSEDAGDDRA